MISDRAKLAAADIAINTRWNMALEAHRAAVTWRRYALEVPSTARTEQYNWVNALPQMKEWLGDAQFTRLKAYKYTLENKYWQEGLEVLRDDIMDDRLGLVQPAIDTLAEVAARHPDKMIFNLMVNGFTGALGLAYDGQFFFDTDHKDGSGATQSNKGTAVLAAPAFEAALVSMSTREDESGEPLTFGATTLVVPPQLAATAKGIIETEFLTGNVSNVNFHAVSLVVEPRLKAHPTKWFLLDESRAMKPFVFQTREALQFAAQDSMTDEHAFMRRVFRYSAFARYNAGYGMWQMAFGSDGTV